MARLPLLSLVGDSAVKLNHRPLPARHPRLTQDKDDDRRGNMVVLAGPCGQTELDCLAGCQKKVNSNVVEIRSINECLLFI